MFEQVVHPPDSTNLWHQLFRVGELGIEHWIGEELYRYLIVLLLPAFRELSA